MANTINCEIVSAEGEIFKGSAALVVAPGVVGELGIAPQHAPLITRIRPGQIRVIATDGSEQSFYVSGGLLEVQPKLVSVLADTAVRARDLDEAAVRKAKHEAELALANRKEGMDLAEAQARLAQANAQLEALERLRKTLKH